MAYTENFIVITQTTGIISFLMLQNGKPLRNMRDFIKLTLFKIQALRSVHNMTSSEFPQSSKLFHSVMCSLSCL
jgi:hypothetical protein